MSTPLSAILEISIEKAFLPLLYKGLRPVLLRFRLFRRAFARSELARKGLAFDQNVFIDQVRLQRPAVVKVFLAAEIPPDSTDRDGNTGLIVAADRGHVELVKILLAYRVPVDARNAQGVSALLAADAAGHEAVVQLLQEAGAAMEGLWDARLLAASRRGETAAVREALQNGARVGCRDMAGRTPLFLAAEGNHLEAARALLDASLEKDAPDDGGNPQAPTPLMAAAARGYREMIALLLERGARVDERPAEDPTPLMLAVAGGHTEAVKLLLGDAPLPEHLDARDRFGRTALLIALDRGFREIESLLRSAGAREVRDDLDLLRAALRGDLDAVRSLLARGAQLNVRDQKGNSPLILAATRGRAAVVQELLGKAAVNARNAAGCTALMEAARAGHRDVVELLLTRVEVEVDAADAEGDTALILAAREARAEIVDLLLGRGADPDVRGQDRTTALLEACAIGALQVVEALLGRGAGVDARALYGNTPLMAARLAGFPEVAARLVRAGARAGRLEAELFEAVRRGEEKRARDRIQPWVDLEARDWEGRTALIEAAGRGHAGIARALLDKGVEAGASDRQGRTALELAAGHGHTAVLELLVERCDDDPGAIFQALIQATRKGQADAMRVLVRAGADKDGTTRLGDTPLVVAVGEGQIEAVAALLDLKADINRPGRYGLTPLAVAILGDRPDLAAYLVERGAGASLEANLLTAARTGDANRVRTLLEAGASLAARDLLKRTALMAACEGGHLAVVELLLSWLRSRLREGEEEALAKQVRARDREGRTALLWAARGGHAQAAKALLNAHAEVNSRSHRGRTALLEAARNGDPDTVQQLIKAGADLDARDDDGNTPLKEALVAGHQAVADLLIAAGAVDGLVEARLLSAAACDLETVRGILRQGVDTEVRGRSRRTALLLAAEAGCREVVEELLQAGAEIEARDAGGNTALILAARSGNAETVDALRARGADVNAANRRRRTALLEAAEPGHADVVAKLLAAGANANAADRSGITALILAARGDRGAVVERLLASGRTEPEVRDREGRTALFWALVNGFSGIAGMLEAAGARQGRTEALLVTAVREGDAAQVARLLAEQADVRVTDARGEPLLLLAAREGQADVVKLLLQADAGVDGRGRAGRTPLLAAAAGGHRQVVADLLETGADPDARDSRRSTALLEAARKGDAETVSLLLAFGAAAEAGNTRGETALVLAAARGHLPVVEQLLAAGVDVDVERRTAAGRTALMAAAAGGHAEVLRALLARKPDVDAADHLGQTALDLAFGHGHDDCVTLLEEAGAHRAEATGIIVYLAPQGDRYHRRDCGSIAQARANNLLLRLTVGKARAAGFSDCQLCLPDRSVQREEPGSGGASFSVVHPRQVSPARWLPFYAYAFRDAGAEAAARDMGGLVEPRSYQVSSAAAMPSEGDLLTAVPDLPGFEVEPASLGVRFRNSWHRFDFRLRCGRDHQPGTAPGRVSFTLEGVIVADVPFAVEVVREAEQGAAEAGLERVTQRVYDKVFASYSRDDRRVVERVESAARALGLDYLRDVTSLHSGDDWSDAILRLIDEADVFQLFWSASAGESEQVAREWEHALKLVRSGDKQLGFIRPVYWTEPLHRVPAPLQSLHFRYEPELAT